ncbi:MAG: hypothetical protein LUI02_06340 [Clostridiales bacterium]|nr:hypothetical protein [Clostridiales bacterium]
MKRRIIKPIVMVLWFVAALAAFGVVLNQDNPDLTTTMEEASLPVVYFEYDGTQINELHGYVTEMDVTAMRDSITPMDNTRLLPMTIYSYGANVTALRYEIRSIDGERLVAKNDISDYEKGGGKITAQLQIQNVLEEDEEYAMLLILTADGREVYYYTRLMQTEDCNAAECLEFSLEFHDYTFRDDADDFIPTYMDPATGDPTTLDYVDLTCTLRQITWADFVGEKLTEPVASFKEINDSYDVLTLQYVMVSQNEYGESEFYNVEEYYRLRLTTTRMYVLNFERRMNQIFRGENTFLTEDGEIMLGIRNSDIEYMTSETEDIIAFVQEGELWCFDRINGRIAQVYSYRSAEGIDARENWDQHDIKIVRVDEAGSVDFVVYGYMNRGTHEGEVGIGVYHYDGLVHTVEEEVFIPSEKSYEILKAELGQLMYVNDADTLYLMMGGDLYAIDLTAPKASVIVSGLKDSCYEASASNRYFAWVDGDAEYKSTEINLMDLSDGSTYVITEDGGAYLRPLGFIDEDFIYGAAYADEVMVDAAGNTVFPMYCLKIMATSEGSHDILKTYEPDRGRVESISVEDYTILVQLFEQGEGGYASIGTDSIMNRVADTEEKVSVQTRVTDEWETQRVIVMKNAVEATKIIMITSNDEVQEEPRILSLDNDSGQERFYVYVKGDVILATDSIADAIILANESLGIVVDTSQQYVWMRAHKTSQSAFSGIEVNDADKDASSVIQSVSAMLAYHGEGISVKELIDGGETPKSALELTLRDSMVLDVSGCTVDEIVFYISNGSPVFAMTGSDSAVLVTGYTSSLIYYYDPAVDDTLSMSYEDADVIFSGAGNIFFTYLD